MPSMNMQITQHLPDLSLNYIEQGTSTQKKRGAVTIFSHTDLSGYILLAVKIGEDGFLLFLYFEIGAVCEVVGESAPGISGRVASFLLLTKSTLIIPASFPLR